MGDWQHGQLVEGGWRARWEDGEHVGGMAARAAGRWEDGSTGSCRWEDTGSWSLGRWEHGKLGVGNMGARASARDLHRPNDQLGWSVGRWRSRGGGPRAEALGQKRRRYKETRRKERRDEIIS